MSLLVLIIANILIINIWLRVSETIFNKTLTIKHKTLITTLGAIVAVFLWQYPNIAGFIQNNTAVFSQNNVGRLSSSSLIVYGLLVLTFLGVLLQEKPTGKEIAGYLVFIVIIGALTYFAPALGIGSMFLYYLIIATSEETVKYFGSSLVSKGALITSDKILRAVLIALGFSFVENLVYILPSAEAFIDSFSLLLNRGAVGFLMHSIFTGLITLFIVRAYQSTREPTFLYIAGAFIAGIGLHLIYNTVIYFGNYFALLGFIAMAYFLLTYLFYHADRLYLQELIE